MRAPSLIIIFDLLLLSPAYASVQFSEPDEKIAQWQAQQPFSPSGSPESSLWSFPSIIDNPRYHPRIDYSSLEFDDGTTYPPEDMTLHPLHVSGPSGERVDLTFFSDGYTNEEEDKFVIDAQALTDDIVSPSGAMGHVAHLLNIWGVFVRSITSGIGVHDTPLPGAAFGLYRSGSELRGVYLQHHKRARAACRYWREGRDEGEGGCDQAIVLGNDPLYGGLGGEFTIITASKLNGPLVLRHELGHSLIPVGEEYEGGFAYFGVNSDKVEHLDRLKWKRFMNLADEAVRIEDVKVPLQVYPWKDLSEGGYKITFESFNRKSDSSHNNNPPVLKDQYSYPTALLRLSLSSIPYPSHISFKLNGHELDLSEAFLAEWEGSKDRRWLEVPLLRGIPLRENTIAVELTKAGEAEETGQGGKMITSLEIMEYGGGGRFNGTEGHIGAYPTYAMDGTVTLRPTNEECLMRKVNHPTFCPICAAGLEKSLERKIRRKQQVINAEKGV